MLWLKWFTSPITDNVRKATEPTWLSKHPVAQGHTCLDRDIWIIRTLHQLILYLIVFLWKCFIPGLHRWLCWKCVHYRQEVVQKIGIRLNVWLYVWLYVWLNVWLYVWLNRWWLVGMDTWVYWWLLPCLVGCTRMLPSSVMSMMLLKNKIKPQEMCINVYSNVKIITYKKPVAYMTTTWT